jgi:hypothetical protein
MDIAGVARRIPDAIAKVPRCGPFWDHTFCALVNDLRVCGRHARPPRARTVPATWENALPLLTGVKCTDHSHHDHRMVRFLASPAYSQAASGVSELADFFEGDAAACDFGED